MFVDAAHLFVDVFCFTLQCVLATHRCVAKINPAIVFGPNNVCGKYNTYISVCLSRLSHNLELKCVFRKFLNETIKIKLLSSADRTQRKDNQRADFW